MREVPETHISKRRTYICRGHQGTHDMTNDRETTQDVTHETHAKIEHDRARLGRGQGRAHHEGAHDDSRRREYSLRSHPAGDHPQVFRCGIVNERSVASAVVLRDITKLLEVGFRVAS